MNYVNFQSRLRRNFSGSVNFKPVFSSDSVNVARPLSKTTTKSMSQPILLIYTDRIYSFRRYWQMASSTYFHVEKVYLKVFYVFIESYQNDKKPWIWRNHIKAKGPTKTSMAIFLFVLFYFVFKGSSCPTILISVQHTFPIHPLKMGEVKSHLIGTYSN